MIVLSVANQKGGVGKTTTSIELGVSLAKKNKRVLLLDFDQQANLSKYVGADLESASIYEVLHGNVPIMNAIQHVAHLDILTASSKLSLADREFIGNDDVFLLADLCDVLKENDAYDIIIIDNGPTRNVLLTMSYIASDYLLVPTECDDGSLDGILAIDQDLRKLRDGKRSYTKAQILGFILTKNEKTVMHHEANEELIKIAQMINKDAFVLPVRKSIAASEAKTVHQSLQDYEAWSNPAIDYRKIADWILEYLQKK